MSLKNYVVEEFERRFGTLPWLVVRAPGRVNLIGEHTDYNEGFVMPMAIDRASWIAFRPRADRKVSLYSMDHQELAEFELDGMERGKGWREYPKGMAWALMNAGFDLTGWEGTVICDVPLGAGLSSSASFELAVAKVFAEVSGFSWDGATMAGIAQQAENQWVGVNCGIMDQMISAVGRRGHAVMIDCRNLAATPLPLPEKTSVVILDTTTRRGLVESAYNERRTQCENVAAFFGVSMLRDVNTELFLSRAHELDEIALKRARHVVSENERVLRAAHVMLEHDAVELGALMNLSHDSLRDDFEVCNDALNIIVDLSRREPGCLGARMTGAGFGGCAVALVRESATDAFVQSVAQGYEAATGRKPAVYVCQAADGAETLPV